MQKDSLLIQAQTELKEEISFAVNGLLMRLIFDRTSQIIQKVTRSPRPPSFLYTVSIAALVILLPSLFIALLWNEGRQFSKWGLTIFLGLEISLAVVIVTKLTLIYILTNLRDHIVGAICSIQDLSNLREWLVRIWSPSNAARFGIFGGILTGSLFSSLVSAASQEFVGFSFIITSWLVGAFFCVGVYHIFQMVILPTRLSRYQFELLRGNPRRSNLIRHLSRILNNYIYILAPSLALITLFFALNSSTSRFNVVVLITGWVPLILQFISNQSAMTRIITTAKWKYLKDLELQIESMQTATNFSDKETVEAINRLLDFHERVSATRNSTLDLRAGLNFLNQLLLPLAAFALANFKSLTELFR